MYWLGNELRKKFVENIHIKIVNALWFTLRSRKNSFELCLEESSLMEKCLDFKCFEGIQSVHQLSSGKDLVVS